MAAGQREAPVPWGPPYQVATTGRGSAGLPYELRRAPWRPSRGHALADDPPGLGLGGP
ncbi:hypothetical protein [Streptomyces sp. SP18CS02]|uniref:hypothetical protein n=1 Tax=Streptomyces sp. SP18CS02 TaxID=3002531 RepID=UPI002E76D931|nr:hypothetical protein [Streptomyces sp. SP18CS02]MEE1752959.1 hypothetical protein [Streptomyces sp. SP18CS02]